MTADADAAAGADTSAVGDAGADGRRAHERGVFDVFRDGGVIGADLALVDWRATPLGDPAEWPQGLVTILRVLLTSRFSMWMAWGDELTFFCNDAYRRDTLGKKYPWALGRPASEVWGEIWADIGPRIERVLRDGVATWDESLELFVERSGYREETYHTFSYSPLADEHGATVGMLCVVAEETDRVVSARRMMTLRDVAARLTEAATEEEVFERFASTLAGNSRDLPFSVVYLLEPGTESARPAASTGLAADHPAAPAQLTVAALDALWPGWRDHEAGVVVELDRVRTTGGEPLPATAFAADCAVVMPLLLQPDTEPIGLFVAGVNPFRPADDDTLGFVRLLGHQLGSAIGSARSFAAERRRAEALAELDRAKTQFFANVSHELRTPLTLIAGPLAELRRRLEADGATELLTDVDMMQRNTLRLGKLVNAILDFSRLQAGQTHGQFEPLDLAGVTADLVSMFRPAVEQTGLELVVDCRPLSQPVFIDVPMWENVVLNLLSNALKFTFAGAITVTVSERDGKAVVEVTDTGVGVPSEELPRLFERFHRVERTRARSGEGSGIGLALVAEIIELHGGAVTAASTPDVGTTFTVALPFGKAHLAADHVVDTDDSTRRPSIAWQPFLSEALQWSADPAPASESGVPRATPVHLPGEVLVVDDNADMRAYLKRLLADHVAVRTAANGEEALVAIRERAPDLVLSDVMMPEVDGIELVRRLRAEPGLAGLPIVLLTAASGSESTSQGLDVGADDYLVKPFTADNLIARVTSRLTTGRERRLRQALQELAAQLGNCQTPQEVLQAAQPAIQRWCGADASTLALVESEGPRVNLCHVPGFGSGIDERWRSGLVTSSAGPIFESMRTVTQVVLDDPEQMAARYPAIETDLREAGILAIVATPISPGATTAGGCLASAWRTPHPLNESELDLHRRFAAVVEDAVRRMQVAEREHRLVDEFQAQLLEIDHRVPTAVVAAAYQPAERSLLVGGDWYDVISLTDGSLGVSVGDVVGKGLPAATVMSQLRSSLRVAAMTFPDPSDVLDVVDRHARRVRGAMCASAVYLRLTPNGEISWSCAGHPPPLVGIGDDVHFLQGGRRSLLGSDRSSTRRDGHEQLPPGSLVLLYTDGLVERRGESLDVGMRRLAEAVEQHRLLSAGQLCDAVLRAMVPPGGFQDDVAIVALRTPADEGTHFVDAFSSAPANLAGSRRRFRSWLRQHVDDEETVAAAVLALGEAIANAAEHGNRLDIDRIVGVEAAVRGGTLRVAVTDGGRWDHDSSQSRQRSRGRGFTIINAVAAHVLVSTTRIGTRVTFEIDLGGSHRDVRAVPAR